MTKSEELINQSLARLEAGPAWRLLTNWRRREAASSSQLDSLIMKSPAIIDIGPSIANSTVRRNARGGSPGLWAKSTIGAGP